MCSTTERVMHALAMPLLVLSVIIVLMPEIAYFLYRNRHSWTDIMNLDCKPAGLLWQRGLLIVTCLLALHYSVHTFY